MSESLASADVIASAIARAGQLATFPDIALEVVRVAENPNATGDDLVRVLSQDPTLSARVLKIVNSAYYGVRREVSSISTAIGLLGFGAVRSIAIAASLTRMFRAGALPGGFDARDVWKHSIAVATAARQLASRVAGVDPSDVFLAGLMHDIGIIIELQSCREGFSEAIAAVAADPLLAFRAAEQEALGATHEAFGEALCVAWRFPASLQRVTGYHHRPLEVPTGFCATTAVVFVADHLAARIGVGYSRTVEGESIDEAVLTKLCLTAADVDTVAESLAAQVAELFPLLNGED